MNGQLLEVRNLGKAFRTYRAEWQRVLSWMGWRGANPSAHWVIRGVDFNLAPGEVVGIIGHNGAGKSTLLKMITGTLRATEGEVRVSGRVGAILELGLGFHPELTGRDNAIHAIGLMGFSGTQIQQVLPEVERFAEIGEYFDQPVRVYSSGMQMRLAFAVVTAYRPDLLIVDEALSVGDAYFQQKCFERIKAFREAGSGLLFVSHDLNAVKLLCDRVLVMDHGRCLFQGAPEPAAVFYNQLIARLDKMPLPIPEKEDGFGTGEARIARGWLDGEQGNPGPFSSGEKVRICLEVVCDMPTPLRTTVGILLRDRFGQDIYGVNTEYLAETVVLQPNSVSTLHFDLSLSLGPGKYTLTAALHSQEHHLDACYHWADALLSFEVAGFHGARFVGIAGLGAHFSIGSPAACAPSPKTNHD